MAIKYYDGLSYFCNAACFIGIFAIWLAYLVDHGNVDSVSIYTLDRRLPDMGSKLLNQGNLASAQSLAAQLSLLDYCVMPDVHSLLIGVDPVMVTKKVTDALAGSAPANTLETFGTGIQNAWNKLFVKSWGVTTEQRNGLNMPYDGGVTLPPQHFSPLCRCLNSVLSLYKTFLNTSLIGGAQNAASACLATQPNIPRQKLVFDDKSGANGTKALSRTAFLLIMGLALLINLVYRQWVIADPPAQPPTCFQQIL